MDSIAAAYRRLLEIRTETTGPLPSGEEREKLLESRLKSRLDDEIGAIRQRVPSQETQAPPRNAEPAEEGRLDLFA